MKSLFEIAKSGLQSASRSMSITSNNIINADTPGYSRQRIEKSPNGMHIGQSYVGLGVNIDNVVRLRDKMDDILLHQKQQNMGYLKKKADLYGKLEATLVSDSGNDLDSQVSALFDNFSNLASNPQDSSVRNNLLSEALQFTSRLQSTSEHVDQISEQNRSFAGQTLKSINKLLNSINELNKSIKQGKAKGQPDFKSLDIRDEKLSQLSKLVDFQSQETETGAVKIQIGGKSVVDENEAYTLKSEVDNVNKKIRLRLENGQLIKPSGGAIGAQIEMYQEDIPNLKKGLDKIAATVVSEFNKLHSQGYGLDDNNQRDFFDPSGTTADTIQLNQNIVDNPNNIAASSVAGEAGNGDMATKIADLRDRKIIGDTLNNQSLTNYTIGVISKPGVNLNSIDSTIEVRDSEIQMLKNQQEQTAGVNVDEELSRMIKFQNAYQGAAKVMSSAQKMYDTLISIVR